jgi:regulatory protein RepA
MTSSHKSVKSDRWLYWGREEGPRTWNLIPGTPDVVQKAVKQGAMFLTWAAMSHPINGAGPEPHRWGDLPLDFDDKGHPEMALIDFRRLCLVHLPEFYDVDPHAIRYFVSGSKGFSAELPAMLLGAADGDPLLPTIYKRIVCDWASRFDLKTLDLGIYNMGMGRMWRIPNVLRSNGRYKVPIAMEELRDLPFDDLWALGDAPRQIEEPDVDLDENPNLGEIYRRAHSEVHVRQETFKDAPKLSDEDIEKLSAEIPQCIRYIIANNPPKTVHVNFHRLCLNVASYFDTVGAPREFAWDRVQRFVETYQHSATYDIVEKRRREWFTQWAFVADNDEYRFDCKFILGLRLPGSAFECKKCLKPEDTISLAEECPPDETEHPETTEPPPQSARRPLQLDIAEMRCGRYLDIEPEPVEWTIEDSLPKGKLGLLVADGGVGKGHLALQLGISVAAEIPFLDGQYKVTGGNVLILTGEDDRDTIHRRVRNITRSLVDVTHRASFRELINERLFIESLSGKDIRLVQTVRDNIQKTQACDDLIESCIKIPDLQLIIIDPLSRFYALNENDNGQGTFFCSLLENLSNETGAATLLSHHNSKEGGKLTGLAAMTQHSIRGCTAFTNAARWQMNLAYLDKEKDLRRLKIDPDDFHKYLVAKVVKKNLGPPERHFYLKRSEGGTLRLVQLSESLTDGDRNVLESIKAIILKDASGAIGKRYTIGTLSKASERHWEGYGRRRVSALIAKAIGIGELGLIPSKNNNGMDIETLVVK